MTAGGAGEGGQLIPGIPEEVVLAEVVPRLPWYTRPLCRALSKSWRTLLDTSNAELDLRTRTIQVPLLRGAFLFYTYNDQIFISGNDLHEPNGINGYQIQPHWRKLPPLKCFAPADSTSMVAISGMVYAWSNHMLQGFEFVSKLDLGCADWTWKKVRVPYAFSCKKAVSYNAKIYVPAHPRMLFWSSQTVILEHDMRTDICRKMETWNHSHLRLLLRRSAHSNVCVEEMYDFEEMGSTGKLAVVMYDAGNDSWRTKEEVPIPTVHQPLSGVELLNGDCFEPASESGIGIIVWCKFGKQLMAWFNSALGTTWVEIDLESVFKGDRYNNSKYFDNIQFIRGSMYKVLWTEAIEEEEDTKEKGSVPRFCRKAIMKGKIIVESSTVVWEEVHGMGFLQETNYDRPKDWYTVMG